MTQRWMACVLGSTMLVGCSDTPLSSPLSPSTPSTARPASAAPPALSAGGGGALGDAVVTRAQRAFRVVEQGFRGKGGAYTVRVAPGGAFSVAAPRVGPDAVDLRTLAIGRDRVEAAPARGARVVSGGVHVDRGIAVETLFNGDAGVEQAWRFATRPEGDGDLVVHVEVSGLAYAGHTAGGHHFRRPGADSGFRYGVATWIDADGRRSEVLATWEGDHLALRVPAAVVDGSGYPAILDPVVGPEQELDEPVTSLTEGQQAAIASNGVDFLVVWVDFDPEEADPLYATRVSAAGAVLGGAVLIADNAAVPAVAWDGTQYVVAYADSGIYVTTVSSAGEVAGPPRRVGTTGNTPTIASNGSNTLVVWAQGTIFGTMFDTSPGLPNPPSNVLVCGQTHAKFRPAAAWTGSTFVVGWTDFRNTATLGREIYLTPVAADRTVATPCGVPLASSINSQDELDFAVGGGVTLALFTELGDVYAIRLDPEGAPIDAATSVVASHPSSVLTGPHAVSADGAFSVVWTAPTVDLVLGTQVPASGPIASTTGTQLASAASEAALGFNGLDALVAWTHKPGAFTLEELRGRRFNPDLSPVDGASLELSLRATNPQLRPQVATVGGAYLVAWNDDRSDTPGIYATRVDPDGEVLDAPAFFVTAPGDVTVAAGGPDHVLILRSGGIGGIHGTIFDDQLGLGPSDVAAVTTQSLASTPAVAWDGSSWWVIWSDRRNASATGYDLFGTRVTPSGTVTNPGGVTIWDAPGDQRDPVMAAGPSGFLLAWHHDPGIVIGMKIHGVALDAGGTPVSSTASILAAAEDAQDSPALVWDGTSYFMVWEDDRDSDDTDEATNVYAARVSTAGVVVPGSEVAVTHAAGSELQPDVAFDGELLYVAWHSVDALGERDARFAALDASGAIVATGPISVTPGVDELNVDLAVRGVEQGLAVYERDAGQGPRVYARVVRSPIQGDPCEADDECSTGFCVDGVCCDTACGGGGLDCTACSVAAGAEVDGVCGPSDGNACFDGDHCTLGDRCDAGACGSATTKSCPARDPCHLPGTCNPGTGLCSDPVAPDGTACDDARACTQSSACASGSCVGSDPVVCDAGGDPCRVGVCNDFGFDYTCGTSVTPGVPCDDGDPDTVNDHCQTNGQCVGAPPSCEELLADSEAALAACEADAAQCETDFGTCDADLATCEGEQTQCVADRDTAQAGLGQCAGDLNQCEGDLGTCEGEQSQCVADRDAAQAGLGQCAGELNQCEGDLGTCEGEQTQCVADRDAAQAGLGQCAGELNECEGDLGTCEGEQTQCVADLGTCEGEQTQCVADRDTAQAGLGQCAGELNQCEGDLGTCEGGLGACQGELGTCQDGLGTCQGDLGACDTGLGACQGDLATCRTERDAAQSGLGECSGELGECEADRAECVEDRDLAQAGLDVCAGDLGECEAGLGACEVDLAACEATGTDSDGDGEQDARDACPGTPPGAAIDDAGCSNEQFCARVAIDSLIDKRVCNRLDWHNDEPVALSPNDCRVERIGPLRGALACVPDL